MAPEEFTQIKHRIEDSSILSDQEKKEWLFLLPKMSAEQIKELDRVLSIKMPVQKSTPSSSPPSHGGERVGVISPVRPPISAPQPAMTPSPPPPHEGEKKWGSQSVLPGIRSLTVEKMRSNLSVYRFLEQLAATIRSMLEKKVASREEIKQAFEQSPLYKAYLDSGLKIMSGERHEILSRDEFEALADFREALKKILSP